MRRTSIASPVLAALAALFVPAAAHAEEVRGADVRVVDHGPNRLLLATGAATIAFSYGVSAYLGATSERESERFLLVPLVGPFITIGRREDCGERPLIPCDIEPTYKALLAVDGAIQLAGAAQIALAFVVREHRQVDRPLVMPLALRGGAGIGATGTF